jgi:hypothetical protein
MTTATAPARVEALQSATAAIREFTQRGHLLVNKIVDINESQSAGEINIALWTALAKNNLAHIGTHDTHFACGAYRVDQAAMELQKRLLPLDTMQYPASLAIVNVAQIAEASGGRRKDHVWVGVTKAGGLAVGYAAPNSPILDRVLSELTGLWEFNTPASWDEGRHFRTRDVLTKVAAGLIADSSEVLDHLIEFGMGRAAREHFAIRPFDATHAWWPDSIGWERYNIKTGFDVRSDLVTSLKPGDKVRVRFGEGEEHLGTFALSLQESNKPLELVFCHASSGYEDGKGEAHFCDLMVYGGNAYSQLGHPTEYEALRITKA